MSTTRIKEKISALVSSQLPEFIQSDFPTFIAFIEAYYRFLEQDQGALELVQNARSYADIDSTTNDFVEYFLKTYAYRIPESILLNKRFLIKRIKDLYESKGSEISFKILFQILFDTNVSVSFPFENVLRPSSGNWSQRYSLRLETVTGNRNDIANRIITYTTGGIINETPIVLTKNLTTTLTEVFLDSNFLAQTYTVGDTVEVFQGSTLVYSGIIKPTTVSFNIQQAGIGFKVGQIFTINSGGGVDTLVKVTSINSIGGITEFSIINFGFNYNDPTGFVFVTLDSTKSVSETVNIFSSKTQGFGSKGSILVSDPLSPDRYFLEDYLSDQFYTFTGSLVEFNNSVFIPQPTVQGSIPANFSFVRFNLGALARYPGSYTTNNGFLSEPDVRLQDNKLFQPFAYLTNSEIDIEDFYDIVIELIHPAGQNLFNNRILNVDIDLSGNVSVITTSNISFEAYDSLDTKDDFYSANIFKSFIELQPTLDVDEYEFFKNLDDSTIPSEENQYALDKIIDLELFFEFDPSSPEVYFGEDYVQDIYTFTSVTQGLTSVTVTENISVTGIFSRIPTDTANVIENSFNTIDKNINNNESLINVVEVLNLQISIQDYAELDYFQESYVITPSISITI